MTFVLSIIFGTILYSEILDSSTLLAEIDDWS